MKVGDVVALEVVTERARFGGRDRILARHQSWHGGLRVELDRDSVQGARAVPRKVEGGFAQRFARQRPGVHGRAARLDLALDDRHPLLEIGGLRRRLLASRSSADHHQIEMLVALG
jgi:hypothetical protein